MSAAPGAVLVVGRTLDSARSLRDARPELAGARLGSPLSARSLDGLRVREVHIERGLDRLSPGMMPYVRRLALLLERELRRMGAERVFHVLPVDGGPAVVEPASAYCDRVRRRGVT